MPKREAKYVVRSGYVRGAGDYFAPHLCRGHRTDVQQWAKRYSRAEAIEHASAAGWRIVRLVSRRAVKAMAPGLGIDALRARQFLGASPNETLAAASERVALRLASYEAFVTKLCKGVWDAHQIAARGP